MNKYGEFISYMRTGCELRDYDRDSWLFFWKLLKKNDDIIWLITASRGVVVGNECTLLEKVISKRLWDVDTNLLLKYCLLRYFLWYIITGDWCIDIVKGRYTTKFMDKLSRSYETTVDTSFTRQYLRC